MARTTFPTRVEQGMFVAVLTGGGMLAGTVYSRMLDGVGFVIDVDPLHGEPEGAQHTAGEHAVWEPLFCAWFAACDAPAVRLVAHPTLVAVPACASCAARAEA